MILFCIVFDLQYLCRRNWFAAASCRLRCGCRVVIKRESGERPEQSRCCKRLIGQAPWSLTFFREDRLLELEDASQKTCRC